MGRTLNLGGCIEIAIDTCPAPWENMKSCTRYRFRADWRGQVVNGMKVSYEALAIVSRLRGLQRISRISVDTTLLVLRTVALANEASRLGSNLIRIPLWNALRGQHEFGSRKFESLCLHLPFSSVQHASGDVLPDDPAVSKQSAVRYRSGRLLTLFWLGSTLSRRANF